MSTMTSRQTLQAGGLARLASAVTGETALTLIASPGSKHTGGIEAQPAEYERRVIAFFDRTLLPTD